MTDIIQSISNLPPGGNVMVLVVLILAAAGVVTSIGKQVRKYTVYRQELEFKRELIERGLSVEEIERIVAAKGDSAAKDSAG